MSLWRVEAIHHGWSMKFILTPLCPWFWAHVKQLFLNGVVLVSKFSECRMTNRCKPVSPRGAEYMIVIGVGEVLLLHLLLLAQGVYLACVLGMPLSVGAAEGLFWETGQLSLRLTRRLWRTPLWHRWLTGSLFLDLWNLILPSCPALWPRMSQCVHTSRLRHSDGPRAGEIPPTPSDISWAEGDAARLLFVYNILTPCREAQRGRIVKNQKQEGRKRTGAEKQSIHLLRYISFPLWKLNCL